MPEEPRLLGKDQVAEMLSCSTWQVTQLMKEGQLPSIMLGKRKLVFAEDVHAYVDRQYKQAKAEQRKKRKQEVSDDNS